MKHNYNKLMKLISRFECLSYRGKSTKALPAPLVSTERKPCLKLLGVTFQSDPCNWDLHFDNIIKAIVFHIVHSLLYLPPVTHL